MPTSKLDILLTAKNKASGPIKQVSSDLGGLDKAAGLASAGMAAFAVAGGVAAVTGLAALGFAAVDTAANFKRLEVSFQSLTAAAGTNADAMLDGMKKASQGMISDSDLILAANKAMLLGVASSTDEMVALMEIAAVRGQAMGLSMTQAFNDIVTGLGRGSALILDNLGITINLAEVNNEYAASLGRTVASLSELEKKQALVNAVLAQGTADTEIIINSAEQATVAWANLKTEVSTFAAEYLGLSDIIGSTAGALTHVNTAFEASTASIGSLQRHLSLVNFEIEAHNVLVKALSAAALPAAGQVQQLAEAEARRAGILAQLSAASEANINLLGEYSELTRFASDAQADSAGTAGLEAAAMDVLRVAVDKLAAARDSMRSSIASTSAGIAQGVAGAIGSEAALSLSKDINSELIVYENSLRAIGTSESDINFLVTARGNEIRQQTTDLFKAVDATGQLSQAAKDANQEFENIKSKVAGLLSGALSVSGDVGINLDDLLPRKDAINEDARRLADVAVNGWDSPWASYLNDKFPQLFQGAFEGGDLKGEAAKALRAFEQGLNPQLLDKEAAKERVRTMLIGDANMAELAQEIATELAEEMGGVSDAGIRSAVSRALGIADLGDLQGEQTGDVFGSGAVQGVGEAGTQMVATLNAQLKLESNVALIRVAGTTYGATWGAGFLETVGDNVPPALISLLVSLITPGVQAGLQVEATQTEAGG